MEKLYWQAGEFSFGKIVVCCSDKGVREVHYGPARKTDLHNDNGQGSKRWILAGRSRREKGARIARRAVAEIGEYLAGRRQRFTVPLDLSGTPFQQKVWKALLDIPYGATRSYHEIARQVGNPRAARAVGMANHWNPAPLLVPCHRVIASDGSLGGYAGGVRTKSSLLRLEQNNCRSATRRHSE